MEYPKAIHVLFIMNIIIFRNKLELSGIKQDKRLNELHESRNSFLKNRIPR